MTRTHCLGRALSRLEILRQHQGPLDAIFRNLWAAAALIAGIAALCEISAPGYQGVGVEPTGVGLPQGRDGRGQPGVLKPRSGCLPTVLRGADSGSIPSRYAGTMSTGDHRVDRRNVRAIKDITNDTRSLRAPAGCWVWPASRNS